MLQFLSFNNTPFFHVASNVQWCITFFVPTVGIIQQAMCSGVSPSLFLPLGLYSKQCAVVYHLLCSYRWDYTASNVQWCITFFVPTIGIIQQAMCSGVSPSLFLPLGLYSKQCAVVYHLLCSYRWDYTASNVQWCITFFVPTVGIIQQAMCSGVSPSLFLPLGLYSKQCAVVYHLLCSYRWDYTASNVQWCITFFVPTVGIIQQAMCSGVSPSLFLPLGLYSKQCAVVYHLLCSYRWDYTASNVQWCITFFVPTIGIIQHTILPERVNDHTLYRERECCILQRKLL